MVTEPEGNDLFKIIFRSKYQELQNIGLYVETNKGEFLWKRSTSRGVDCRGLPHSRYVCACAYAYVVVKTRL